MKYGSATLALSLAVLLCASCSDDTPSEFAATVSRDTPAPSPSWSPSPTRPPSASPKPTSKTAWKSDPECSFEALVGQVVEWMDSGVIPDNAQNESSAHVIDEIEKAEAKGGSCEAVRNRLLAALI